MKAESPIIDCPTKIECLTFPTFLDKETIPSVTPGFLPQSSGINLKTKLATLPKNALEQSVSETLLQGSTSSERVYRPYWNEQYEEISSLLLSHIGIDWLASASISLNGSSNGVEALSWSSMTQEQAQPKNSLKTSLPSLQSSAQGCTDSEATKQLFGIKRTRLYLNPEQTQKVKRWFGVYRYVFNRTVDHIHDGGYSANYKKHRKEWTALLPEWVFQSGCPAHTIYGAMMDAERAMKSIFAKRKQKLKADKPIMRRRTQKTCFLLGSAVANGQIYPRLLGKIRSSEPLPQKPKDSRLLIEAGKVYVLIPETKQVRQAETQGRVCALDPGVRTFLTWFSPDGIGKIGQGAFSRIVRLAYRLDDLISRSTDVKGAKEKKRYQRAIERARARIRNLVDDLQYQSIAFLVNNFDLIIFPEADFTGACKKAKRKIRKKSVRSLLTWAFAKFRDRLIQKATLLGKTALVICEAYTSKTANWTGEIKPKLGGAKTITSNGVTLDRDVNAAFGIFLKATVGYHLDLEMGHAANYHEQMVGG